jgi:hypothetical protein
MVPGREKRKRVLRLYERYNDLELALCSFAIEDIDWEHRMVVALFYMDKGYKEEKVLLPDVVYNRCYTSGGKIISLLESIIGENKCFNHKNQLNKWEVYEILKETILKEHLPKTCLYDGSNLKQMLLENNLLFLKPCNGNQGRGIYRMEKLQDGNINISKDSLPPRYIFKNDESFIEDLGKLMKADKKYIIQKGILFIPFNNKNFDIRALVQKDINGIWEVSNLVSRISYENYYNTSIVEEVSDSEILLKTLFTDTVVMEIIDKINLLSITAAEEIDRKFKSMAELGVDFGIDRKGHPWIIEVNGFPYKSIYSRLSDLKSRELVYKRPLEFACFLAAQQA